MKRRIGSLFYRRSAARSGEIARKRWHVPTFLRTILRRTCLTLGALMLFSICLTIFVSFLVGGEKKVLPQDMVLVFNITDPIGETGAAPTIASPFSYGGMAVADVVAAMDRAAADKRVRGLLVGLDNAGLQLAHIQELRAAIARFRAAGKFAHIYTASFGDLGSGIGAYYFASAFDEIWMQPVGFLSLTGIAIEMPFARAVLDKIGVNPEFLQREEYKSAMENLTNSQMSPENREMTQSLLDSISAKIFNDIATDRNLSAAVLRAQMDKGIITGGDALKAGLITRLDYSDVLVETVNERLTGKKDAGEPPLVTFEDYAHATRHAVTAQHASVALVNVAGQIVPGNKYKTGMATSDYIAAALADAADNDAIKVVVVRVDSPGGSPTASETIRRAIVHAKENGKKVVVSMGTVAASGGYWVSVDADKIYALPSTLTGSIGVIMGKFELSGLWQKLGVNWDSVTWGENARLWSNNKPLDEAERAALSYAIDDTYASFIKRVADGRNMKPDDVRGVAKGRAWTGLQAKDIGLVDEIGGLDNALDYAATLTGKKDRSEIKVVILPQPPSAFERLRLLLGDQGVLMPAMMSKIFGADVEPALRTVQAINRGGPIQAYDPSLVSLKP